MSGEKTKIRLTSLDITALVCELKAKLIGLRVANIYDINQKTYLFKLSRGETKEFLLVENGIRFHTTDVQLEKSKMPSGFTMKFRKFLRSKRLEDIKQIGVERVVILTFGSGESTNHVILELYSSGNIILTDKDFNIILLMRQHEFSETVKTAIGERYPFEVAANLYIENFDSSEANIEKIIAQKESSEADEESGAKDEKVAAKADSKEQGDDADEEKKKKQQKKQNDNNKQQPKGKLAADKKAEGSKKQNAAKASKGFKLREIVFKIVPSLHNPVIDHVISENGFNPNTKIGAGDILNISMLAKKCIDLQLDFSKTVHKGFLIVSDKKDSKSLRPTRPNQELKIDDAGTKTEKESGEVEEGVAASGEVKVEEERYFDFSPLVLTSHAGKRVIEMDSYNNAIDKFFRVMASKIQEESNDVESIAWRKYENIKNDQLNRIQKLKNEQEEYVVKAQLIEMNVPVVDAIINIIRTLKQSGESWDKITKMINEGKKSGDPMANLIHQLDFEANEVSILLGDPTEDMDELTAVAVELSTSAHVNARNYYENKKRNILKEKKTFDASKIALKQAEKTALKEIENIKLKTNVVNTRKMYWFEKFYWFISSENYLVISGRDMQQNEMIVKKYMKKGDIYMHADFHGAASTVIKNPMKEQVIPQQTIDEAAIATICRSKAWEAKIVSSAWWVYDHQVSKRAEAGEFLPSGSFMIRGKKNFVNPPRMEMGCTLLYKMDDQFVERHANDRRRKDKDDATTVVSGVAGDNQQDLDDLVVDFQRQTSEMQKQLGTEGVLELPLLPKSSQSVVDDEVTIVKLNQPPPPKPKNAQQINKEIQAAKAKAKLQQAQQQKEAEKVKLTTPQQASKKGNTKSESSGEDDDEEANKNSQTGKPLPRGKRNKVKKMMEKYADQDEEDRMIRMQLMGAKNMKDVSVKNPDNQAFASKKKGDDAKETSKKEKVSSKGSNASSNNIEQQSTSNASKVPFDKNGKLVKDSKSEVVVVVVAAEVTPVADVRLASSVSIEANQSDNEVSKISDIPGNTEVEIKLESASEKNEVPAAVAEVTEDLNEEKEENLVVDDEDDEAAEAAAEAKAREMLKVDEDEKDDVIDSELQDLQRLATFTYPEETFSATILMCAPYSTISLLNSKYKVKLVPGTLKKGKASKSIVHFFQSQKDSTNQEKKALRNMTEQEIINCLIGNVKLAGAGLQKIKDKEKVAKKQARKTKDAVGDKSEK